MKFLCCLLFWGLLTTQADSCAVENRFFSAYTSDNKRYVEVCLLERQVHFIVKQNDIILQHLTQPLTDVDIHTWFDSYELIVNNNTVTLAIIDHPERTSLLTLNKEKGTGYFNEIAHNPLFTSRLYALKQQKVQWVEEEKFILPPFIP